MNKKIKNKGYRERLEIACLKCKAKFDIWLSNSNLEENVEERIKEKLLQFCPKCRAIEA